MKNISIKSSRTKGKLRKQRCDYAAVVKQLRELPFDSRLAVRVGGNPATARTRLAQAVMPLNKGKRRGQRGWITVRFRAGAAAGYVEKLS